MPPVVLHASSSSSFIDTMRKNISEKRKTIEQSRSVQVRKIQQDVKRIINRERESAKEIMGELMPVPLPLPIKVTWKPDALKTIQEHLPFVIEFTESGPTCHASPAMDPTDIKLP